MANILVFTSLFPNRYFPEFGTFIKKRMKAYANRENCNIVVISPVPYFPSFLKSKKYEKYSKIPKQDVIDGIKVYYPRYPLIPKISMLFQGISIFISTFFLVRQIHKTFSFDLIDGHFIYPDCFAAVLHGKFFHKPVVVSARGSDIHEYMDYSWVKFLIKKTLHSADSIISVCSALKKIMVDAGIEKHKIHIIPNGIDKNKFYYKNRVEARNILGLDSSEQIVLSVGALIRLKGHHLTISAIKSLAKKYSKIKLYIIGKGSEKEYLEMLIEELNLPGRVLLTGEIPNHELIHWYNAADVFCLSSKKEGWANVLTESLACGTPCVATNVFGSPEIITENENGFLVERKREDIEKGITKALSVRWDRVKISEKIQKRTWDTVAQEVDAVFSNVIENQLRGNV